MQYKEAAYHGIDTLLSNQELFSLKFLSHVCGVAFLATLLGPNCAKHYFASNKKFRREAINCLKRKQYKLHKASLIP